MSSDDDEVVLQKHTERLGTSLARPLVKGRPGDNGSRRQSRESQSQLPQAAAGSRQSKYAQPARQTGATAPSDDDSDNEASVLNRHNNKLAKLKVGLACLV